MALYAGLFGDPETAELFSDRAQIDAFLTVEGALARVQGARGVIPPEAAAAIDRAARSVVLDPAALAAGTARNGVPIPAFLAAFRAAAGAPGAMAYLHWGATSQDIMDTALALRLRAMLDLWQGRLDSLLDRLAGLAADHALLPMTARTYGQAATPTSFGAVVAGWGWPLIGWRGDLAPLRAAVLRVSLSGAAGTLSAMGPQGPALRAALARELGLSDPGHSWHSDRAGMARLAGYAAGLAGSLGKLGEDLVLLTQSGIGEVGLEGAGGSSTMPQKQNPVGPSALVALARHAQGLAGGLAGAGIHRQQRDGAAWFAEWLALPPLAETTGAALLRAAEVVASLTPNRDAMARGLAADGGLIQAEALSFALARRMPRPEAQALVKAMCAEVIATGTPLADLAAARFPGTDWAAELAGAGLGTAPDEARAFAAAVRAAGAARAAGGAGAARGAAAGRD